MESGERDVPGWTLPIRVLAEAFGAALTGSRANAREFVRELSGDFSGAATAREQRDALMLYSLFYGLISGLLLLMGIGLAALADSRHHRALAEGITDFAAIPQLIVWWVPILYFQFSRVRLRRSTSVVPAPGWSLLGAATILAIVTAVLLHLGR